MEKIILVTIPILKSRILELRQRTHTKSHKDAIIEAVRSYLSAPNP
jgi:hypothetical protein